MDDRRSGERARARDTGAIDRRPNDLVTEHRLSRSAAAAEGSTAVAAAKSATAAGMSIMDLPAVGSGMWREERAKRLVAPVIHRSTRSHTHIRTHRISTNPPDTNTPTCIAHCTPPHRPHTTHTHTNPPTLLPTNSLSIVQQCICTTVVQYNSFPASRVA